MLKLSKDKTKFKRRIPFKLEGLDRKQQDQCMIYVENFPDYITHEQLASVFKKGGHIKHVSIPKYQHSKLNKGFGFIEYSSPEEAKFAFENLNNFIPEEFWNSSMETYVPVSGPITALKVLLKTEWLKLKE